MYVYYASRVISTLRQCYCQ